MALFTIGDLHLSLGTNKPMDIFPGWENYLETLTSSWQQRIGPDDVVVLAGDTSWAMKLEDCTPDFDYLNRLPGKKLLLKGNHDYWWTTRSKMTAYCRENEFGTLDFIHNNAFISQGVALCGTRSWMVEPDAPHDAKIMRREAERLRLSLDDAQLQAGNIPKLVFLHYPPLYPGSVFEAIIEAMEEHGVTHCFYGHLHGKMVRQAVQGLHQGIMYKLISADAINFSPFEIDLQLIT